MNCKVWWEMATTPIIPVDVANKSLKKKTHPRSYGHIHLDEVWCSLVNICRCQSVNEEL